MDWGMLAGEWIQANPSTENKPQACSHHGFFQMPSQFCEWLKQNWEAGRCGQQPEGPHNLCLLTLLTALQMRSQLQSCSSSTQTTEQEQLSGSTWTHWKNPTLTQHRQLTEQTKPMKATIDQIHNSAFSKLGLFCLSHISIRKWNVWAYNHTFSPIYFPFPRSKSQYQSTNFAVIGNIK